MGDRIVEKLMNEGLISEYPDVYELKSGDLSILEKFGEKSADNLIASIERSKNTTLARVLYSLGIRHVGEETADLLARQFKTLEKIAEVSFENIENIEGIGPVVAKEITEWFADVHNKKILSKLLQFVVIEKYKTQDSSELKLQNKIFVLTGTLTSLSRDEAKAKIKSLGGKVASSVSSNTDYVVAGENPGSKFNDAQKLGITTINETEFLKMTQ
jgi:DNA ligase (NAD+)